MKRIMSLKKDNVGHRTSSLLTIITRYIKESRNFYSEQTIKLDIDVRYEAGEAIIDSK